MNEKQKQIKTDLQNAQTKLVADLLVVRIQKENLEKELEKVTTALSVINGIEQAGQEAAKEASE